MNYTLTLDITEYGTLTAILKGELRERFEKRHLSFFPTATRTAIREKVALLRKVQATKVNFS